jgi:glycosyltransferase involved in cell wall biosynthesis
VSPDAPMADETETGSAHPSRPIRIAFCHYTSDVCGGSDRSLLDLVTHLDRAKFSPFLVLKTGDPLASVYREAGCTVAEIPFVPPRRALEWGKLLRFFAWFWPHVFCVAWFMCRWRIDLVHVNTLNNIQGSFAAKLALKPLVWHVRELVPQSRADALLRRLVACLATRVVANSPAVAETLRASGDRLRTILNGIDLCDYPEGAPTDPQRFEAEPLVACVGRQEPWKGQHVLVEALPALFETHPNTRVYFVGGGAVNKPDYGPGLVARCEALGVAERVTFTGIRDDVPDILRQATILVLPSVTPEPFGRTLVEGMAAGCAVVATAAGGPLVIVEDQVSGVLVPPDDSKALAASLVALLDEPERMRRLGAAGQARARACFSLDRLVDEMADLFTDVYTIRCPKAG